MAPAAAEAVAEVEADDVAVAAAVDAVPVKGEGR